MIKNHVLNKTDELTVGLKPVFFDVKLEESVLIIFSAYPTTVC